MLETLTITDNRTGRSFETQIEDGAIRATALREAKLTEEDFGLMSYDPAFLNTASVRSAITFIDGDRGILRYRGYPIEQLAEQSTYLETAYLLLFGELPTNAELARWSDEITHHTFLHENVKTLMEGFRYDAHPMGMLVSVLAALSTFYPEASQVDDPEVRMRQVVRLIAKVPTIAAWSYRHSRGLPYIYPDNELGFTTNFLSMMYRMAEPRYHAEPALERALEVLFILHADHEQNCSANAMRSIGSSKVDPYSAMAGAAAALYGPLHGGANEAVLRMLAEIGEVGRIPEFIAEVKAGHGRLMGFGHRIYKNYDPRAKIIKQVADEVFEVTGRNPLARHRARAREDRARRRVLRQPEALPERRLLLGDHLPGARTARGDVPGDVRDPANRRLARPVARRDSGSGAEDRPPAPALRRPGRAAVRADRRAEVARGGAGRPERPDGGAARLTR